MWRPKNWDDYYKPKEVYGKIRFDVDRALFEAGADAMLQALKQQGEYVDASKAEYGYVFNHIATYPRTFKGWFVLIEEEQNG